MRLNRQSSQLLIIDVQEKLAPAVVEPERLFGVTGRLIQIAKRLNVPITVSQQYPQGLGATVAPLKEMIGNEGVFLDKTHFSCLGDDNLRRHLQQLRRNGRNQVVVTGMETHVCVAQTVLDLKQHGFDTFVVADAVSSRTKESRGLALERLRGAGAVIIDSEMVLFEWLEKAGTPEFRELHRLIK